MKTTQSILFAVAVLFVLWLPLPRTKVVAQAATPSTPGLRVAPKTNTDDVAKIIDWRVLAPENGKPFNDPFAKLTNDQLENLSYVARIRRLIAEEKIDPDGVDAKASANLARKLTKEGIDIGYLLVQRQRVQQNRRLQVESRSKSIAESLGERKVALAGYVIPIKVSQERLTEFFLVPTMAACSHEDAPPRLMVVFVSSEQGLVPPDRRTPVRVTGKINARTMKRTTVNGNGRVMIHSAYEMSSPQVEVYQPDSR